MQLVRTKRLAEVNLSNGNITVTGKDYSPELQEIITTLGNLKVAITNIEGLPAGTVDLTPVVEELKKVGGQVEQHRNIAEQLLNNTNQNLAQVSNLAAGISQTVDKLPGLIQGIKEKELKDLTEGQLASLDALLKILTAIEAEREFFQFEFDQSQELQQEGNTFLSNINDKLATKRVRYVRKEEEIDFNQAPVRVEIADDYSVLDYTITESDEPPTEEKRVDYTVTIDGETAEFCDDAEFEQPPLPASGNEISTYNKTIFNFPNKMKKKAKITVLFRQEFYEPMVVTYLEQEQEDLLTPPLDMEPNAPQF